MAAAVYFRVRQRESEARAQAESRSRDSQIDLLRETHRAELARLDETRQSELAALREQSRHVQAEQRQQWEERLAALREQSLHAQAEQRRQWEERLATLRLEFDKLTREHLALQQDSLKATNRESLDALLAPFRQDLEGFRRLFGDKMGERVQAEAVLRQMVSDLGQRTSHLDETTATLTRALRGDAKKQGDWGEAVLNNILEASGLERGRDFFVQQSSVSPEGQRFIPDVKVKLHGDTYLIIDSKASIANYLDYVAATDAASQQQALRAHLQSVRKHVAELAEKHYPTRVKDAAEYVLMFVPNEGSYLLAVDNDPRLVGDAFAKGIIVVNPTLLMLALRIVWLFWQNEKQARSVNAIIAQAQRLYEKFVTFSQTYTDLGQRILSLQTLYKKGEGQLASGPANIVKQVDGLRQQGIISEKRIDAKLLDQSRQDA